MAEKFVRLIREDELPKEYEGEYTVTKNGTLPVAGLTMTDNLVVEVPIPEGYIKPEGNVNITENGVVDVKSFETATVAVETAVVEEVLGYEKTVEGSTVDFELLNEVPIEKKYCLCWQDVGSGIHYIGQDNSDLEVIPLSQEAADYIDNGYSWYMFRSATPISIDLPSHSFSISGYYVDDNGYHTVTRTGLSASINYGMLQLVGYGEE